MDAGYEMMKKGEFSQAKEKFTIASEIAEANGPKNDKFTRSISALANVSLEQAKYNEASTFFKEALEIDKRIVSPNSPVIAEDLNDIGRTYLEAGKINRAKEYFEKALKVAYKNRTKQKALYVSVLSNLATTICVLDDPKSAEEYVDKAVEAAALIEDKSMLLKTIGRLARIVSTQGDNEEASKLYDQALRIEKDYYGKDSHLLVRTLTNASDFYRNLKDYEKAEKFCKEALRISDKSYGAGSKHSALLICHLGLIYGKKGDPKQAKKYLKKGIDLVERTLGDEHPKLGLELLFLGNELVREKKFAEATPVYQRSATILENSLGYKNPHLSLAYKGLAKAHLNLEHVENADLYFNKAIKIQKAIYGEESGKLISILSEYRELKRVMGDKKEVKKIDVQITELNELMNDDLPDKKNVVSDKNRKGRALVK